MNLNQTPKTQTFQTAIYPPSFDQSIPLNINNLQDPFLIDLPLDENIPLTPNQSPSKLTDIHITNNQSFNSFESFIIDTILNDRSLSLPSKLHFTHILLFNFNNLHKVSTNFFKEKCHLFLLDWIWNIRHLFTLSNSLKNNSSNKNDLNIILELLNNILIILETLPIKPNDILDLKLYEKLNKIKKYVYKFYSFPCCKCLISNINFVLDKWKKEIDMEHDTRIQDENVLCCYSTENDSEEVMSCLSFGSDLEGKEKKRKKRVSFNLISNKYLEFNKEEEPFKVEKKKNEYDPLIFL